MSADRGGAQKPARLVARYTVRNPRRTWSGAPPEGSDGPPPDLEVAELEPIAGVVPAGADGALVLPVGATVYLENRTAADVLTDGQVVALEFALTLEPPAAPATRSPPAGPGRGGGRGRGRGR